MQNQKTQVSPNIPVSSFKPLSYSNFRSSFTKIPSNLQLLKNFSIPLSINFTLENFQDANIQSDSSLVRCHFCKSYENPFIEIISPGYQWKCNLCYSVNKAFKPYEKMNNFNKNTHKNLFDATSNYEINSNCYNLTELNNLCYEIDAPSNLILKSPGSQYFIFLIEVSYNSIKNKIFSSVFDILLNNLEDMRDKQSKFAFLLYNTQTFVLKKDMSVIVLPDNEESPFLFNDDIFFSLSDFKNIIKNKNSIEEKNVFEEIKNAFEKDYIKDINFSGALQTCKKILIKTGGIILNFLTSLPNLGKAGFENKNSNFYKETASEFNQLNISFSYFLFPQTNIELHTLSILSRFTGGMLNYYPNFNGKDFYFISKLQNDLNLFFDLNISNEAICRIRANKGVNIKEYYGSFTQRKNEILSFASFLPNHSITFECEINELFSTDVCFQVAMLRTVDKKKKIRIFNFKIPVDFSNNIYSNFDVNMIVHFFAIKSTLKSLNGKEYKKGIEYIENNVKMIIKKYKEYTNLSNGVNLPPSLHALPLLCLSFCKSIVLRPSNYTPMDYRMFYAYLICNSYSKIIDFMIYPVLLPLHEILKNENYDDLIDEQSLNLNNDLFSNAVNLSLDYLEVDGFYLLDTGVNIFLFVGCECDKNLVRFIVEDEIDTGRFILEPFENNFSKRIFEIIKFLRNGRYLVPNYILVRDDGNTNIFKDIFFSYFVEDRNHSMDGINEYLKRLNE
ncbi:COPII subunit [Gurleya vavrai]